MALSEAGAAIGDAEHALAVARPAPDAAPSISNWKLAIYALPSIPIAFLFLPVALLMPPFYASTMHVSLSAVGGFLLLSRGADVILDPLIGKWSDTARSRFGRRKLWMMIGTPILMLGAFVLFMPMVAVSGWYLLFASFIIYAGGSSVGLALFGLGHGDRRDLSRPLAPRGVPRDRRRSRRRTRRIDPGDHRPSSAMASTASRWA